MESFLVSARVIAPMAIIMALGALLRVTHVTDRDTMRKVDRITFRLFMPTLMFYNIYTTDFSQLTNANFILYGAAGLTLLFLLALFTVPRLVKEPPTAAAFGQAILRPNYILFGTAVAQSLYGAGNIGILALMGAVAVPLFNAMSAIVLEAGRAGRATPQKLLLAIVQNPMIIAAILGIAANLSGLRIPPILEGVISDISGLTTPISFLSLGVSLSFVRGGQRKHLLLLGLLIRLLLAPLVLVSGAVLLGFRGQELCALLVLFAAPTAVSSYPMAVAMEADGELAAQMVALTTLFSLGTMFLWILCLSSLRFL